MNASPINFLDVCCYVPSLKNVAFLSSSNNNHTTTHITLKQDLTAFTAVAVSKLKIMVSER